MTRTAAALDFRLSAGYQMWRFTCNRNKTEEHRVWLLPVSHIAIVEQSHGPEVVDVVTTGRTAGNSPRFLLPTA